jgi:hypothetical protein
MYFHISESSYFELTNVIIDKVIIEAIDKINVTPQRIFERLNDFYDYVMFPRKLMCLNL